MPMRPPVVPAAVFFTDLSLPEGALMFTGLVKCTGEIVASVPKDGGRELHVDVSGLGAEPAIGASIALSGACQTVTACGGGVATFFATPETLRRTTLGDKRPGQFLNLEPALRLGDALDGHLVSGHVDATVAVLDARPTGASQIWRFALPPALAPLVAEKGSVAVDGISLTVVATEADSFTVSLIPHTLAHTTLATTRPGEQVNLEADVLARYVARRLVAAPRGGLSLGALQEAGFC